MRFAFLKTTVGKDLGQKRLEYMRQVRSARKEGVRAGGVAAGTGKESMGGLLWW